MVASKKHSSSAKEKPSSLSGKEHGEDLVGSRIRVWWPIDRKFYKGVVDSFNSSNKKHRVLYDDGDKESLDMKKERWEFIKEDNDKADVDDSASENSDATPEPISKKKAKNYGKSSEKGRTDEVMPKKKEKIDSSAKSKSKAKSGKKSVESEGERETPKSSVKKAEKLKTEEEQTPKPEAEKRGKMGDIGGKIVAAASRMSGRFQSKENGQEKETPKLLKSCKNNSESNKLKQKRPSSSSEACPEKVKKPRTSSKKIKSDHEDGVDDTSDDESKPLVSFLKKSPEAVEALMEKLRGKKEKEAKLGSSGNKAEADVKVDAEAGAKEES